MLSRWMLPLALVLALLPAGASPAGADESPGHYRDFGDPGGYMNILPPGQDGVLNGPEALFAQGGQYPPHVKDQLGMYGDLVYNTPGLAEEQLSRFFKDASFGVPENDIDRVYSPTPGVTIVRDKSFGVPHIFGETRYATMFAQGYTAAEDRLFLMDVLRHVGRGRVSEFLGASPSNQALDRDQVAVAPYREEDLTEQLMRIAASPDGPVLQQDLLGYVDGVNAYINEALADPSKLPAEYPALQQVPMVWKPEDTVAIASLVGGIFGKGGGGELRNYCGLQAMAATLGDAAEARQVFDDMHMADDPEAPTTSRRPAPYMFDLGPVVAAAHPGIDCASLAPIDDGETSVDDVVAAIAGEMGAMQLDTPWGPVALDFSSAMSNAILIGREHTKEKRPIAVFGPQTAYFMPQLLVEKDVHGPGIDARGAAFAGTDLYVQLGRGTDYAWSATSSGADNIDQFVLRLCEPDGGSPSTASMGYEHDGTCQPIETYQHTQVAKPSAGGVPEGPDIVLSWRVDRTERYGPLVARGTLTDGTPIAIASLRSTYFNELGSAKGFFELNNPANLEDGFESFRQIMGNGVHYTFNWFYIDGEDIGYQHSCRCPRRAQGVDPYLPAWGTGRWDWQGFISQPEQPWDKNPDEGYITSWNNKQAPRFKSSDREFSYGPTYRSQLLDTRIETAFDGGKLDRADVVDIMEDAGTVDLRGQEVLPLLLSALGPPPAGVDARAVEMRDRLETWAAADAHRRDHDRSGEYDDPQSPAIMDAWWPRLAHAMFDGASGNAIDALGIGLHDPPQLHLGSAFNGGFYGQVQKDLRRLLGRPVSGPFSRTYCGSENAGVCGAALWASLEQAAADLEAQFGSPDVAAWKREIADDDVRHTAVGVTPVEAIHWINRPTFQQVVQVGVAVPVARSFGAGSLEGANGGKIGFTFEVASLVGGQFEGRFRLHDQKGKHKIEIDEISTASAPATDSCGAVQAGAPQSIEFAGTGRFDGTGGHSFHVCAQDNDDPGKGADILHVDCATCPYSTSTAASSETLRSGNLVVHSAQSGAEPPQDDAASVIMLEPALGLVGGLPVTLAAIVLDGNGAPVAGVPVSLVDVTGLFRLPPLTPVTGADGRIEFAATTLDSLLREWTASAGSLDSNPVRLR